MKQTTSSINNLQVVCFCVQSAANSGLGLDVTAVDLLCGSGLKCFKVNSYIMCLLEMSKIQL